MTIRDITPCAQVRHGYRVFDSQRIGNMIYRWNYDLVIEGDSIEKLNWQMTAETITPAVKPAIRPASNGGVWYSSPEHREDPYKDDPFWDHWNFEFQQWQEDQKQQRI